LKLRLLRYAIRTERIVVDWNERGILEVRLMLDRHQGIFIHDERPADICRAARGPAR
jgi:hypothetical protein